MGQVTGRPLGCNASPGQPASVGLGSSSQRAGGSCPQCHTHSHTWQAMGIPTGAELPVGEGPGSATPAGSRPLQPTGTLWEHIPHQGTTVDSSVGGLALSLTCTSGHLSSPHAPAVGAQGPRELVWPRGILTPKMCSRHVLNGHAHSFPLFLFSLSPNINAPGLRDQTQGQALRWASLAPGSWVPLLLPSAARARQGPPGSGPG